MNVSVHHVSDSPKYTAFAHAAQACGQVIITDSGQ